MTDTTTQAPETPAQAPGPKAEVVIDEKIQQDRQALQEAKQQGRWATFKQFVRMSGPGWLQGAITLGNGSLGGGLFLGVIAGVSLMWLQPLAMALGIVMLSAIGYVVLSTGERPFGLIKRDVNPVLAWGWVIATVMANMVWCMPQFQLGIAALQQNLLPGLIGESAAASGIATAVCVVGMLAVASLVVWFYNAGRTGIRVFEGLLKALIGLIVICFIGVVVSLTIGGELNWGRIAAGFVPDLSLMFHPADSIQPMVEATGSYSDYWSQIILTDQRNTMLTAVATAVGINMTFILPYSMLAKGWDREFRGMAMFDLGTGLLVPFMLTSGCVMIAAASQFHAQPAPGLVGLNQAENPAEAAPEQSANLVGGYMERLDDRLMADDDLMAELGQQPLVELKSEKPQKYQRRLNALTVEDREQALARQLGESRFAAMDAQQKRQLRAELPEADREMAAALVHRDAANLASSLQPLTGPVIAQYVFGIGVVAMAISTIVMLMLINGFAICEMANVAPTGYLHRIGALLAGISGALAPFVWTSGARFWLVVPTSVIAGVLLPIAYAAFFLLMNNRRVLGDAMPTGRRRLRWNLLMGLAFVFAAIGAFWGLWSQPYYIGIIALAIFIALAVGVHFLRQPANTAEERA